MPRSSKMAKKAEISSIRYLQQPLPRCNLQQLWPGVGGKVNSRREGGEAASAGFKRFSFEQAWTPSPGVSQNQAKELFVLPEPFFRKSGKAPKAWIVGNVALTSIRRSGISLHKTLRKFLAEAQRPIYAGVKGTVISSEAKKKKILFLHGSWVVSNSLLCPKQVTSFQSWPQGKESKASFS